MTAQNEPKSLRFASYNIRKAKGLDQRRDPHRVLDVINCLEADVVALQEADMRLGARPSALPRRLIEHETDFEVLNVATNDVSLGWHGNAVLMRKGLHAKNIARIALPGLEPRGAVRFDLDMPRPVTVIATHLGLARRHRLRQLETLVSELSGSRDAMIMGDFNEWSTKRGFEPLEEDFDLLSPGHSFHAARPIAALDKIAHRGGIKVADAGVDESKRARRASDHLPIWADVRVA
ncbi:endonuclease/exonuclease/phosphatase family protein [Planktotalea sp.]|uniref:endonuclease/exonuclease/phosphatase family protein n=1 Tax=Planktotalea sp. TaxID=2029877 RepID=UPI003D6AE9C4